MSDQHLRYHLLMLWMSKINLRSETVYKESEKWILSGLSFMSDIHQNQTLVPGSRMPQVLEPDISETVQISNDLLQTISIIVTSCAGLDGGYNRAHLVG